MTTRFAPLTLALSLLLAACGGPHDTPPLTAPTDQIQPPLEAAEKVLEADRPELFESKVETIIREGSQDERARASIRLAILHQEQGRYGEAAESFAAAAEANPALAPFLRMRQVGMLRRLDRHADALAVARGVISAAPEGAAATDARILLPALHLLVGDRPAAESAMSALSAIAVDEFTEEQLVETAGMLAESGASDLATTIRMRVLTNYPRGRFTETLYRQLTAQPAGEAPVDRFDLAGSIDLADRLARANRYDQTLDYLRRIETRIPAATDSANYRYVKVRSLFFSRNYDEAVTVPFRRGETHWLDAELLQGRAHWRRGRPGPFVETMQRIIAAAPDSNQAHSARVQLARYYSSDQVDYRRAVSLLEQAIAGGHPGNDGENLWTVGWIHILAGSHDEALRVFDRYLRSYPDADYTSNVLFWSAKIHEQRGNTQQRNAYFDRLISLYPYNYYSYRAREIVGTSSLPSGQVDSGLQFPSLSPAEAEQSARDLAIVRALLDSGLTVEAGRELRVLTAQLPEEGALAFRVAQLYH